MEESKDINCSALDVTDGKATDLPARADGGMKPSEDGDSKAASFDIISAERIKRLPGFVVRRAPSIPGLEEEKGYVTVTLSFRADPDKDSLRWLMKQRMKMPDERSFRREYLLDWTSADGDVFYPEFANQPEKYVDRNVSFNPKWPVHRSFDFGFRRPACIWAQVNPNTGRVYVLHDLLPSEIDTYSFRDLVMFLSGQTLLPGKDYEIEQELEELQKRPRAYSLLTKMANAPPWWEPAGEREPYPIPFFPPGVTFYNYSGTEALKVSATVDSTKKERTDAEVFESAGLALDMSYQSIEAGETLIRKLLLTDKGKPGLQCSPAASNTISALAGGIVYATPTASNPRPETAKKDGMFEHVHDALRYCVTHIVEPDAVLTEEKVEPRFREGADLQKHLKKEERASQRIKDYAPWESEINWNDLDSFC